MAVIAVPPRLPEPLLEPWLRRAGHGGSARIGTVAVSDTCSSQPW